MHLIMLSGGSGKRLWPLSNETRSKQFLKILKDNNGDDISMIQRIYRLAKSSGNWDSIVICAGISHLDQIRGQLGKDVKVALEPERRDTFPAILLASSYIYSNEDVSTDDIFVVIPVDVMIDDEFFVAVKGLENLLVNENFEIGLLGVKPSYPSEKFGYIIPDKKGKKVSSFVEKPNIKEASSIIEEGGLWNCGVFSFKAGYLTDLIKSKYMISDFSYEKIQSEFSNFNKNSFDYEIVEKAANVGYLEYEGRWKDLGTWDSLCQEISENIKGNTICDENCKNTHVINENVSPLIVMGITDSVIISNAEGVLVTKKESASNLKKFTNNIEARPMFEEKRWGSYKIIDRSSSQDGEMVLTKKLCIKKGCQISYQYHEERKEIWTVIHGKGILYFEGEKRKIDKGETIIINKLEKHGIKATTELEIIEVQMGIKLSEEDIVRLEYDWE